MLGMSCVLTCFTDTVPWTAMDLCFCIKLTASCSLYIKLGTLQGNQNGSCTSDIQNPEQSCTKPTKKIQKSCAFWLWKVFPSAGSFRTVITDRCKFCPSGFSRRLLEAGAWTQFLLHNAFICLLHNTLGKFVQLHKSGRSDVTSETGARSMWPSFRLSGTFPSEAWDVWNKVWRSPTLAQLPHTSPALKRWKIEFSEPSVESELWGAGGRGDTRHCNIPPCELDQEFFWTHMGFLLQILIWQDQKSWYIDFCQDRASYSETLSGLGERGFVLNLITSCVVIFLVLSVHSV